MIICTQLLNTKKLGPRSLFVNKIGMYKNYNLGKNMVKVHQDMGPIFK